MNRKKYDNESENGFFCFTLLSDGKWNDVKDPEFVVKFRNLRRLLFVETLAFSCIIDCSIKWSLFTPFVTLENIIFLFI